MKVILSWFTGYLQVISEKKGRSKKQNVNDIKSRKERILLYMIKLLRLDGFIYKDLIFKN